MPINDIDAAPLPRRKVRYTTAAKLFLAFVGIGLIASFTALLTFLGVWQ